MPVDLFFALADEVARHTAEVDAANDEAITLALRLDLRGKLIRQPQFAVTITSFTMKSTLNRAGTKGKIAAKIKYTAEHVLDGAFFQ